MEELSSIVTDRYALRLGDSLECMRMLPDASVDLVLTDLPYGTTPATWDKPLPMPELWAAYERLLKPTGAVILNAVQPFTSLLIVSKLAWFKCEWIWHKVSAANFANARHQPMKVHENVVVFAPAVPTYNPMKTPGPKNHTQGKLKNKMVSEMHRVTGRVEDDQSGMKFPVSIVTIPKHSSQSGFHPTQKPTELGDYFVRTYSNLNEVVLDNTMGSGSYGVAAIAAGRRYIGIENNPTYFKTACDRIAEAARVREAACDVSA